MSRPRKAIVDYFPHYVNHGKTMFTIENKYGNDGYAFWFKVLEQLGAAEHHFLDCNDIETWEFLLAKTRVNENIAKGILDTCSKLGAIDRELWDNKIIRSDNFIINLDSVYKRREVSVYSNDEVLSFCKHKSQSMGVSSNRKPQSKVKDSIVNQSKQKETIVQERIKENPNPLAGCKNQEPGKEEIQEEDLKPKPEAEEKTEIQEPKKTPRARRYESQNLLEDENFNQPDLAGGEPEPESEQQEQGSDHNPEVEPDRKVISISAEPKTQSNDPKVERTRDLDWDDEPVPEREPTGGSVEALEPQLPEELDPKESVAAVALNNLKQDPVELKSTKKIYDDKDW